VQNTDPTRAHAIAPQRPDGRLQVSLRLPRESTASAHELDSPFGGGGRRGAAGIDALDASDLPRLAERLAALG
jgi:nanoRNase/pAp phosphatase (c-di-AMP/oligoRNAs hydrolase)